MRRSRRVTRESSGFGCSRRGRWCTANWRGAYFPARATSRCSSICCSTTRTFRPGAPTTFRADRRCAGRGSRLVPGPWRRCSIGWPAHWPSHTAAPRAGPHSCPAGFWHRLRLEAFDGTTFEVADTEENDAAFERPAGSCGPGGYPQVRVVALVECATHAVLDAVIGGRGQGETTLALDLAGAAGPGTLVLADRNMLGVQLWTAFRDRGAELLWRLKKTVATRPEAVLEDGSWLARVRIDKHTAAALRRAGQRVPGAIT